MRIFWARFRGPPRRNITTLYKHRYVITELTEGNASVTIAPASHPTEIITTRRFPELWQAYEFVAEHAGLPAPVRDSEPGHHVRSARA